MVTVIITDYERAVLDVLRENPALRVAVNAMANLPATAEADARAANVLNNKWRAENGLEIAPQAELSAEIAQRKRWQEQFRLNYKAGGYKPPYEYGKGRVKVVLREIKGGNET